MPPGMDEDKWLCWVKSFYNYGGGDIDIYNRWWCDFVVSEVLDKIREANLTTKKKRTEGRWVLKRGIRVSDKQWDIQASIGRYGRLFAGTDLGYHREFEPKMRGREFGKAGSFIILWDTDASLNKGEVECVAREKDEYGDPILDDDGEDIGAVIHTEKILKQNWFNSLACVYALLKEAERKGDHVTLLAGPGNHIKMSLNIHYGDSAKTFPMIAARDGETVIQDVPVFRTIAALPPALTEASTIPLSDHMKEVAMSGEERTVFSRGPAELSEFFKFENNTNYEHIINTLMKMQPPERRWKTPSFIKMHMVYLNAIWDDLPKTKRSTIVVISTVSYPMTFWLSYRYIAEFYRFADFFIVDVGARDNSALFEMDEFFDPNNLPVPEAIRYSFYIDFDSWGYRLDSDDPRWREELRAATGLDETEVTVFPRWSTWEGKLVGRINIDVTYETAPDVADKDSLLVDLALALGASPFSISSRLILKKYHGSQPSRSTVNYVYVGSDVKNMTARVLSAVGAELGGWSVAEALGLTHG